MFQHCSNLTIMTPFFLQGRDSRAMQRDLSYHDRTYHQHDTNILSSSTGLRYRTRNVQPSPYYTASLLSERPPSWFSSRSTRQPYDSSLKPALAFTTAEIAHRSLAHDLYASPRSPSRAYTCEAETYSDRYTTYYPDHEPSPSLVRKKKTKAGDVRVQRRGDELVFVRSKGKKEDGGGWRKTERDIEWLRGQRWM